MQDADIDIENLASLARLALCPDEKQEMARALAETLDFVAPLAALDTEGTPPTVHTLPLQNVLRADEAAPPMPGGWLQSGAPAVQNGFILVPKVVEQGE